MCKLFQTLVLLVCGALFSGAALATPTLLYEFKVNRATCFAPHHTCDYRYSGSSGMTIGLAPAALAEGQAELRIFNWANEELTEFYNNGFMSINLNSYKGIDTIYLDINKYKPGIYPPDTLNVQVHLEVDRFLKGSIYLNDSNSEVIMGTSKGFPAYWAEAWQLPALLDPASMNEWTGLIRSDALEYVVPFTGEWKFVGVVPEPGTLALLLSAMAATAWVFRRRILGVNRLR
ncbi:MAG: PEP-CTERM sorting domain-containing protein [Simplicispira sp.]|nr:PEP-CTERM sorting domain-containing protein [Simplicispira sp.]